MDVRDRETIQSAILAAVAAEREACAKLADEIADDTVDCAEGLGAERVARAIRERGKQ